MLSRERPPRPGRALIVWVLVAICGTLVGLSWTQDSAPAAQMLPPLQATIAALPTPPGGWTRLPQPRLDGPARLRPEHLATVAAFTPGPTAAPLPSSTPGLPPTLLSVPNLAAGIYEYRNPPVSQAVFYGTTAWTSGGPWRAPADWVYAGMSAASPRQGMIVVSLRAQGQQPWDSFTPTQTGPLYLTAVDWPLLTLVSEEGITYVFDLDSRTFLGEPQDLGQRPPRRREDPYQTSAESP